MRSDTGDVAFAALGHQVFVDVRPGAGSNIGAELGAKAPADGYTLTQLMQSHTVNASLYRTLTYDVLRDFAPVTRMTLSPLIVVGSHGGPVGDVLRATSTAGRLPVNPPVSAGLAPLHGV